MSGVIRGIVLKGKSTTTASKLLSLRYNSNIVSTNKNNPNSVTVQFVVLFSVFSVGSKLLSALNFSSIEVLPRPFSVPYSVSSIVKSIGDVVAFGAFSLLSTQKVLLKSKNTLTDALLIRPNDMQHTYKLAGGRIGARTAAYFVLTRECLRAYSDYHHHVMSLEIAAIIPLGVMINVLGLLPGAMLMPWLYGRFIGHTIGSNHLSIISLYEKSGLESHLIGPRYTYHALKSHPIDLMFAKNPVMSRIGCVFLAIGALSPYVYYKSDDAYGIGQFIDKGDNNFTWQTWKYEWSSGTSTNSTHGKNDTRGHSKSLDTNSTSQDEDNNDNGNNDDDDSFDV